MTACSQLHAPARSDGPATIAAVRSGSWLRSISLRVSLAFVRRRCGLRIVGKAPAFDGPFMVCSNHRSHLDSIALIAAMNVPPERVGLIAARDYFFRKSPHLRILAQAINLIPISRNARAIDFRRTIAEVERFVAAGGRAVIAFPEGTRSAHAGLLPFKRGAAVLAAHMRLPIVPAFVAGTDGVLPRGSWLPRRGRITVCFGEPLAGEVAAATRERRATRQIMDELEKRVRALDPAGN